MTGLPFVPRSGDERGGHRGSCPGDAHSPWIADFWRLVRL